MSPFSWVEDRSERYASAEAVRTEIEPETHDVLDCLTRSKRGGRIGGHHPRSGAARISVVERRLIGEKVDRRRSVPIGDPAKARKISCLPDAVRPDIAIGKLIFLRFLGLQKPRMIDGGMSRDKVNEHVHTARMYLVKESFCVLIGAIARRNFFVVAYIIACVAEGRIIPRIHPDCVTAERSNVVKPSDHAGDIADAVSVRILK